MGVCLCVCVCISAILGGGWTWLGYTHIRRIATSLSMIKTVKSSYHSEARLRSLPEESESLHFTSGFAISWKLTPELVPDGPCFPSSSLYLVGLSSGIEDLQATTSSLSHIPTSIAWDPTS
ncbi:hypothetical protein F4780DRAFT_23130 [Xylariomycetidae sp. FL0641]|nr:hypothetical protein F4780DRAFT_23130 [Xylariomycetidae sp. FL0641]